MKCPKCGSIIDPGKKFCIHCGCAVDAEYLHGIPVQSGRKSRQKSTHIALGALIVVALAIASACMVGVSDEGKTLLSHVFSGGSDAVRIVRYGGSDDLCVNPDTKIVVCGSDGEPIDDGAVQLIPRGGAAVGDRDSAVLSLKQGGSFSFDSFSDIALGDYCMRVFEGSQRKEAYEYAHIVIDVKDESEEPDSIRFKPADGTEGLKQVRHYGVEETKQTINVSYTKGSETHGYSNQWAYVQITEDNDDISSWAINRRLKEQFDAAGENARNWTESSGDPLETGYAQSAVMLDQLRELASIKCSFSYGDESGDESSAMTGSFFDIQTGDPVSPESYFGITQENRNAKAQAAIKRYAESNGIDIDVADIQAVVCDDASYLVEADDLYVILNPSVSGEAIAQLLPLGVGKAGNQG